MAKILTGVLIDPEEDRLSVFLDDEGLLKGPIRSATYWHGYPNPLVGKLLVLGNDPADGDSISSPLTAEDVRARIGIGHFMRTGGRLVLVTDNGNLEVE